ncbi:hypothetical protein CFBP3846_P500035 (plasmid) [Pseudomonas syringae pv. avii]|uniref:Uncharacterized protein n=1 Tax=Pseudomonas syringae pv. avii TaxID=663959 RepID=A0ABY1UJE1_PSESX|nr:hypothetical protein CFBP3846_P500035 [Pseudomonas syringae pv. avii]
MTTYYALYESPGVGFMQGKKGEEADFTDCK